jgi:hypothetical protein
VPEEKQKKKPEYVPNQGFLLYEGEKGEIYMRLLTYVRYLNQKDLDPSTNNGARPSVQQRQDVQLNKFFLPFSVGSDSETPILPLCLIGNVSQGDPLKW